MQRPLPLSERPALRIIDATFGMDPRHTLAEIVKLNTGVTLQANVFKFAGQADSRSGRVRHDRRTLPRV